MRLKSAIDSAGVRADHIGTTPRAVFLGYQERVDGSVFPLYNVVGGALDRSTVSRGTLEREGIPVPETPAYAAELSGAERAAPAD